MSIRKTVDTMLRRLEKDYATHNRIEVSRSAILHNLALCQKQSDLATIPVLKSNAYGHGIEVVARALKGASLPYIAVDGYFEALRIREASDQPVLIMGAILPQNYPHLRYDRFAFVVDNAQSIDALGSIGKRIKVHLECNTGMNRYGAKPADVADLAARILGHKNLILEGVMSHLADSDGVDPATVDSAVDQFDRCVEIVRQTGARPTILHVAQSAGSVRAASRYANTVRLGIALYGINPFPRNHASHQRWAGLRPALQLISTITRTIELAKGDRVSYNYTFTAPCPMKIGVLPLGYYEGLDRALSNKGVIQVRGKYAPIAGRICMNHAMIDLANTQAQAGDEVVVYSARSSDTNAIDAIAHQHNLFNYGLLTSLSADVRRILID